MVGSVEVVGGGGSTEVLSRTRDGNGLQGAWARVASREVLDLGCSFVVDAGDWTWRSLLVLCFGEGET